MRLRLLTALLTGILLLTACATSEMSSAPAPAEPTSPPAPTAVPAETEAPVELIEETMSFELSSPAFAEGEPIPEKYSCKGENISPPLNWSEPPAGTQSFVLIMDDPDAPVGTWDHWLLFNIPSNTRDLEENLPITGKNQDPDAIFVGNNSWKRADYGGPCPPSGTHRYFFKLYALDTSISLLPGADKAQLEAEMTGHILAQTELMGTFSK